MNSKSFHSIFSVNSLKTTLILLACHVFAFSQSFTYSFTIAGTTGRLGPTQAQINTFYAGTNLNGMVTSLNGIQSWTVPLTGAYRIEAYGAKGGTGGGGFPLGGSGAKIQGDFTFTAGQVLKIIAGANGGNGESAGGGGGSFVADNANIPLIIAGGGGGAPRNSTYSFGLSNMAGNTGTSGMPGTNGNASLISSAGGASGGGGSVSTTYTNAQGSGGGGFFGNGVNGNPATGGLSFINGGTGGAGTVQSGDVGGYGGFGGGGGADWTNHTGSGGGGGYSGGGGGTYFGLGGGGGSYNAGTNQVNTGDFNAGNGYVLITQLFGVNIVQTTPVYCHGQSTAVLSASGFGGQTPYTYTWMPGGAHTTTLGGLAAGTYTCYATDANGDPFSGTFLLNEPQTLTVVPTINNVTCNGYNDGNAFMNISGGVAPYSGSWGGTGQNVGALHPGVHSYVVTDYNNCTATVTLNITQPPPVILSGIAATQTICNGQSVTLSATGTLTYSWTGGITNGVAFTPTVTKSYTVIGANAANCGALVVTTITVKPTPVLSISGPGSFCAGNSVTLTTGGADTYTWSNAVTGTAAVVSPTITTSYSVTGTNTVGCTGTAVKTITVFNVPLISANASSLSVCAGNTVALYVGGSGITTYTWTDGISNNVSFSPTVTATYSVTGTNTCGISSAAITITVNALPLVTASVSSSVICNGDLVTLSGNGAQTYTWTGGVINNSAFSPGSTNGYTVMATDGNGCAGSASKTIIVNPLPVVLANGPSTLCTGNPATLYGSGALSYSWTNGITNNVPFSPLSTITSSVTGTDVNGCKNTAGITVTVITVPLVAANANSLSVCAGNSVTLYGSGAVTYTWSGGISNNNSFIPAATTAYTVTGANACGATSAAITITVNPLPAVSANAASSVICSGNTVTLFGSGAVTYTWSNGISDNTSFSPVASASYTVNGTDSNGCSNAASVQIAVHPLPLVIALASNTAICLGNSAVLNGSGALTYTWSGGIADNTTFIPSATNVYTVTGTDVNGCHNTAIKTIIVNPLPVISVNASASVVCTGNSATLTAGGADTYSWTNNVINGQAFSPTATQNYSVNGTNTLTGCTNTLPAVATISVNPLPVISINATAFSICKGNFVTVTASGTDTFTWTNGIGNGVAFTPSVTQGYTVTGTSTLTGCTGNATGTIIVNSLPVISIVKNTAILCSGESASLISSGAVTYTWNTGEIASSLTISPVVTTAYTVSGTDQNGCENTVTVVQDVSECLGIPSTKENWPILSIFPNPNNGMFMVSTGSIAVELTLVNESGAEVKQISLTGANGYKSVVAGLDNGVYIIIGYYRGSALRQKFIVTN